MQFIYFLFSLGMISFLTASEINMGRDTPLPSSGPSLPTSLEIPHFLITAGSSVKGAINPQGVPALEDENTPTDEVVSDTEPTDPMVSDSESAEEKLFTPDINLSVFTSQPGTPEQTQE
jgi:hypothetical protein